MKHPRATIVAVGLSVAAIAGVTIAATAGGSTPSATPTTTVPSATPASAPSPAPTPTAAAAAAATGSVMGTATSAATVHTASATVAGTTETILVDGRGFPLYVYQPDTATTSMVSGELAFLWPPLESTAPTASGANGTLKVVNTSNGHQVTYNGHFLYSFRQDSPGQVTGQGVENFLVATPGISTIKAASPAPAPAPVSSGY
jgi:predicted lipoprotein with Yx(FWY)xxD motif